MRIQVLRQVVVQNDNTECVYFQPAPTPIEISSHPNFNNQATKAVQFAISNYADRRGHRTWVDHYIGHNIWCVVFGDTMQIPFENC